MALIYAGIDEAGYGPMLGPLCVGLTVARVEAWTPETRTPPDLWRALKRAVCRKANDGRRRVAIADSKKLKLANDGKRHPLTHLERGVASLMPGEFPGDDLGLFDALGARLGEAPWYAGDPIPLPVAGEAAELRLARNAAARAQHEAGVTIEHARCETVDEGAFNDACARLGSKAAVTGEVVGRLMREVMERCAREAGDEVRLVCDRQSGRTSYADMLTSAGFAGVGVVEESPRCSRYRVRAAIETGMREAGVLFVPEAEDRHLPVALASMTAKLVRELAMARFNRYWGGRVGELKPTAGYYADARRWLADTQDVVTPDERRAMVRVV